MVGDLKLELPKQVTQVLERLGDYGYSAYIYGECVRLLIIAKNKSTNDSLREIMPPPDFDVLTNAELPRIRAIFEEYNINESRIEQGELIVTVLGVSVSIASYVELEEKLLQKCGFTFDGIAYAVKKGKEGKEGKKVLFDPFGGNEDLNSGRLNFIQSGRRFNPHDILPALAYSSSGEFEISGEAKRLIMENVSGLGESEDAASVQKVLLGRNVSAVLAEYSDVFTAIIPELKMLEGFGNLLSLTYKSVGSSPPILVLRFALLFRELGKPDCHSKDSDGEEFYYGHAERSRIYASRIMQRLGCEQEEIRRVGKIIKFYEKVVDASEETLLDLQDEYSDGLLKELLLFNSAVHRANGDEKNAMKFKKLLKGF
ncbi:MAG: hypothetical protein FWG83_03195 [Oscillospiraceae bacterium]|nr:hypothetical protein [Oscillospiraceae bacterium]